MTAERVDSNKMGEMPVKKLLLDMGIPMMISMMVQALYNVVDGIFVARISENALTAVSMAFPMQNLIIAFSVGNGVGINALLSRALGSGDPDRANRVAKNGLFLQGLSYLLFLMLGIFAAEPFMKSQSTDAEIISFGVTYLHIVLCLSLFVFGEISFERLLQSTGRTKYSMYTQLCGAIFNIVFDPILIFGLLGFPAMGIAGAAAATVGGQAFGMIVGLILNRKKNPEINLSMKGFRPSGEMIGEMCRVSVPSIAMPAVFSTTVFFMDLILKKFSSTAVAVLGVYFKLESIVFMPVFGLNNAIVPIIAFNYGADRADRVHETLKYGLIYVSSFLLAGFLLMQLIPDKMMLLFNAGDNMLKLGVPALRIISLSFIFAGVGIVFSSGCQAFGYATYSLLIAVARQFVVLLPVAWLLSLTGNLSNVWYSYLVAEVVSVTLAVPLLGRAMKKTGMQKAKN